MLPEEHVFVRWLDVRLEYLCETVFLCVLNNPHGDQNHVRQRKPTELPKNHFGSLPIYM